MSSNTTRRERMAALAAEHVRAEDAGDVDATLATFQADAAFELFPCGLRLSGHDRIRRYYEYFFSTSLKVWMRNLAVARSCFRMVFCSAKKNTQCAKQ